MSAIGFGWVGRRDANLRHSWSTLRSLVSENNDCARLDLACCKRRVEVIYTIDDFILQRLAKCWLPSSRTYLSKHFATPCTCKHAKLRNSCTTSKKLPTSKYSPSFPVNFATAVPGHKLPLKIVICPVFLIGFSSGLTTSWLSNCNSGTSARFSAIVLPVTVIWLPSSRSVCARRYFITAGIPPALCKSSMWYLPEGLQDVHWQTLNPKKEFSYFRSARNGARSAISWKSSMVKGMSAARAIARK